VTRKDKPIFHLFPKIDPGTGKRWSVADQGRAALNEVCAALNSESGTDLKVWLRAWVSEWRDSGPNLKKMTGSLLARGLPAENLVGLKLALRTYWVPTNGGQAELLLMPDYQSLELQLGKPVWYEGPDGGQKPTPEAEAMVLFHLLTVNPLCEKLAGPCPRCDRYYIKKRASQKVYCSRGCGNAATAVARTRERIASERKHKLARASAAMKRWKLTATRQDWKAWVASKTGIDQRFLTRAITKGDLVPPKQEK
jgi:hypothetical protein